MSAARAALRADPAIKRTKEQAKKEAESLIKRAKKEKFDELAKKHSDVAPSWLSYKDFPLAIAATDLDAFSALRELAAKSAGLEGAQEQRRRTHRQLGYHATFDIDGHFRRARTLALRGTDPSLRSG